MGGIQDAKPIRWYRFVDEVVAEIDHAARVLGYTVSDDCVRMRSILSGLLNCPEPSAADASVITSAVASVLAYLPGRRTFAGRPIVSSLDRGIVLAEPIAVHRAPMKVPVLWRTGWNSVEVVYLSAGSIVAGGLTALVAGVLTSLLLAPYGSALWLGLTCAAAAIAVAVGQWCATRQRRKIPVLDWAAVEEAVQRTAAQSDVQAASPIADRPIPEVSIAEARELFAHLEHAWFDYISDPEAYFLRRPLLRVDSHPTTARYHQTRYTAKELLDSHPDDLVDGDTADTINAAVAAAVDAWDAANVDALAAGLDPFTTTERVALRRSQHLIALIADPALPEQARGHHIHELRRCLDKLTACPVSTEALTRMPQLAGHTDQLQLPGRTATAVAAILDPAENDV